MPAPLAPPTDMIRRAEARLLARMTDPDRDETYPTQDATGAARREPAALELADGERYVFGEVFASGGLGVVRRAEDRRLGRVIAVKELLRRSPEAQRRFALEAAITARLQHPGVVPLYDLGWRDGGEPFYCMKLVDGESLEAKIRRAGGLAGRLALLEHVIAVADTIAYAHAQQILHRDLKPANVLVGRFGEVVVIDWGLAKDLSGTVSSDMPEESADSPPYRGAISDMTEAGTVMGTLRYMAPEQARGEAVDVRSDIYALGAILYHVLAGVPPFHGEDTTHLALRVSEGAVRELRELDPHIPRELAAIAHRALARDPARRYGAAGEFAADLRRFQAGRLVGAHAYSLAEVARRWIRRHRVVVAAAAVSLTALAGAGLHAAEQERAAAVERARADEAEQAAAEQAERASRAAFEREALARAQRLDASILGALELSQRSGHGGAAIETARAAVHDALASGGPVMAATRALVAAVSAPRVVLEVGSPDDGEGFVRDVLFADDVLVTFSGQFTVRTWDATSGRALASLPKVSGIFVLAGDELLTTSPDGLALRDPHTLAARRTLTDARGPAIGVSPDGRLVAVIDEAFRVHVWDLRREVEVTSVPLAAFSERAWFSADGTRMLTQYWKSSLWSLPDGKRLEVANPQAYGNLGAISPDGTRVATTDLQDFHLELWDTKGAPRKLASDRGPIHNSSSLMFSADGKRLLVAGWYDAMFLYDAEDGRLLRRFELGGGTFYHAALSPDGSLVAVGGEGGSVQIFEVESGVLLARLPDEHGSVLSLRFSPDGRRLVVGTAAGVADVWQVPQGVPARWTVATAPRAVGFAPAVDRFVMAGEAGAPVVHRMSDGAEVTRLRADGPRPRLTLAPDGALAFTVAADGRGELWDAESGALRCSLSWQFDAKSTLPQDFVVGGAAIMATDPEGAVGLWSTADCSAITTVREPGLHYRVETVGSPVELLVKGRDGVRTIFDPSRPERGVTLADWPYHLKTATASHDGALLLTSGHANDGKTAMQPLRLWSTETGAVVAENGANVMRPTRLTFAPDDASFLALSFGRAVLYSTDDLTPLHPFDGLPAAPAVAAFSPDGQRVVIGDEKGAVGLWDRRTGTFGGVLTQLHGRPLTVAFTADGADVIAVGGATGAVRLPASTDALLAASEADRR